MYLPLYIFSLSNTSRTVQEIEKLWIKWNHDLFSAHWPKEYFGRQANNQMNYPLARFDQQQKNFSSAISMANVGTQFSAFWTWPIVSLWRGLGDVSNRSFRSFLCKRNQILIETGTNEKCFDDINWPAKSGLLIIGFKVSSNFANLEFQIEIYLENLLPMANSNRLSIIMNLIAQAPQAPQLNLKDKTQWQTERNFK